MYQTVNLHDFRQAFQEMRPNNFSYEGLEVLFNYLTDREKDDSSYNCELDVIAICCDYVEMPIYEVTKAYPACLSKYDDENPKEDIYSVVMDFLNNNTCVIGDTLQGTIVFEQF
jgi:hypothetical protein